MEAEQTPQKVKEQTDSKQVTQKINQTLQCIAPPVIAVYAIEQGTRLFTTNFSTELTDKQDTKPLAIGERYAYKIFAERFETEFGFGFNKKKAFIDLSESISTMKEEIDSLLTGIQDNDFKEALNWFKEAWIALSGKNIELFKQSINKSYDKAMAAITRINNNASNLLGAYCIKIFCGFSIFSNYGDNILLGLQHVNDTLNELNNHTLLDKSLYNIVSSNIYWNYYQREFMFNAVRFTVAVRLFVKQIIDYTHTHNDNDNNDDNIDNIDNDDGNDEKMDEVDLDEEESENINSEQHQFGDVIKKLFPSALIDKNKKNKNNNLENKQLLLWKNWSPNIFTGKYYGGNWAKIYGTVDFLYYIYPMIFDKNNLFFSRQFMEIYADDLGQYLLNDNVMYYVKPCIKEDCCEINNGLRSQSYIALSLAMKQKIDNIKQDYIPNKLNVRAWAKIYDKILISSSCSFQSIILDRVNESVLLRFSYILLNQRGNNKLSTLSTLCIKGVAMKLSTLNILFLSLNCVCNELESFILDSLLIRYTMDKQNDDEEEKKNDDETKKKEEEEEVMDNMLCLHYLPTSITCLMYQNITYKPMDNGNDTKKDVNDIIFNVNIDKQKEYNLNSMNLRSITIENTLLLKNNMNVLFCEFIANQCGKLQSVSLKSCGLNDDSLEIIKTFYKKNANHTLNLLDLTINEFSSSGIKELEDMFENTLKERKDVKVRLNVTTVEMGGNMGRVVWNTVV